MNRYHLAFRRRCEGNINVIWVCELCFLSFKFLESVKRFVLKNDSDFRDGFIPHNHEHRDCIVCGQRMEATACGRRAAADLFLLNKQWWTSKKMWSSKLVILLG